MRLKLILFPAVLVFSVVFAWFFVWPEAKSAMDAYDRNVVLKGNLDTILRKKDNISKLDKSLGSQTLSDAPNVKAEDFIAKEYLPRERYDERVIHYLNEAASINSIKIKAIQVGKPSGGTVVQKNARGEKEYVATNPYLPTESSEPMPEPTEIEAKLTLEKITLASNFEGKYEDIKRFVSYLSRIKIMNDLVSIKIGEYEVTDPTAVLAPKERKYNADVIMDFYYAGRVKSDNYFLEKVYSSDKLKFEKIETVRNYTTSEVAKIENPEKGRTNPFLYPEELQ